eukprot:m.98325 g.98325  ORF g.98325 m.98325 type:complete len:484 (-) comp27053_c0_seq1:362-1813(-)
MTTMDPLVNRSLYVGRDVFPGEVVLRNSAVAVSVAPHRRDVRCSVCLTKDGLRRCTGCKSAMYCGTGNCQKTAWKTHKLICRKWNTIRKLSVDFQSDLDLLCQIYGQFSKKNLSQGNHFQHKSPLLATTATHTEVARPTFKDTNLMVTHRNQLSKQRPEAFQRIVDVSKIAVELELLKDVTQEDLIDMLCRFQCNNFSVVNDTYTPQASGCFPIGALINHSCHPNCILMYEFDSQSMTQVQVVRCIEPIKAGQEITHSYVDGATPFLERSQELSAQYFFTCTCERCEVENTPQSPPMTSVADTRHKYLDWLFQKLQVKQMSKDMRTWTQEQCLTQASNAQRAAVLADEDAEERHAWQTALTLQIWAGLDPFKSRNIKETVLALFTVCAATNDMVAACTYCGWLVLIYRALYQRNHPLLGLQLYTYGELVSDVCKNNQRTLVWLPFDDTAKSCEAEIRNAFTEAHRILCITHGSKHDFAQQIER